MDKLSHHKVSTITVTVDEQTKCSPRPPDGGYGWVIVVASFLCNGTVDGICGTFGVFLPHFLGEFGGSKAKTALCGSLMAGCFLATGPAASVLINCFGCRAVTMAGGLLATAGLVFSRFASNVNTLIVVYGIIGGVGLGFIYVPSMVMVGYYFERRRALATGIASSGAGIGILVLAQLSVLLLSYFDWKNSNLLLAGCTLQTVVFGALMWPLDLVYPFQDQIRKGDFTEELLPHKNDTSRKGIKQNNYIFDGSSLSSDQGSTKSPLKYQHDVEKSQTNNQDNEIGIENHSHSNMKMDWDSAVKLKFDDICSKTDDFSVASALPRYLITPHKTPFSSKSCHDLLSDHYIPLIKRKVTLEESKNQETPFSASCQEFTLHESYMSESIQEKTGNDSQLNHVQELLLKPLARLDIFYSGSIHMLPEFKSQPSLVSYRTSVTKIPEKKTGHTSSRLCPCVCWSSSGTLKEMLDLRLLKNVYFLIFSLASVFIQLAYFVPPFFISEYAISHGIDQQRAALLISVIGISNVVGRAGTGAAANLSCVNAMHFHNIMTISCGVACFLMPLCTTFPLLLVYAVWFGLSIAAFVPLTTVFLVEYLGLDRLTNAFGLLSMVRGFSSMVGSPVAGALWEASNSYDAMFYMAGGCLIVAGLLYYVLPCARKLNGESTGYAQSATAHEAVDCRITYSEDEVDIGSP